MLRWPALLCAAALALLVTPLGFAGAQEPSPPAPPTLDAAFEPLLAAFNHDAENVRLLLLLDPT